MASPEHVAAVRAFNRFYTSQLGLTRAGLHRTPHPLAEARVLYELSANGTTETTHLRQALAIDGGQLSRLLGRLDQQGLVVRAPSPTDARRQQIALTPEGKEACVQLERGSTDEVSALLDALPDPEKVIDAMQRLRSAIEPDHPRTVLLRDLQPGDLGWIVERHGALYAREYGWDQSFERLAAQVMADFNPGTDRAWIAEVDGARAGCILCVHVSEDTAKLRTLLVEPHTRGLGLGARLVDECIRHARDRGYTTLILWTNDCLTGARRIYERAGFKLTHQAPHSAFGQDDLVEQTWSLNLKEWNETS
jgi:DNA-binding MarR family transcriptional regulator/GNAT superfamily N-acetyltransferase